MLFIFFLILNYVNSCTLKVSQIDLFRVIITNANDSNLHFVMENTTYENTTCEFYDGENITIIIDDIYKFFNSLEKIFKLSNDSDSSISYLLFEFIKIIETKDLDVLRTLCINTTDLYYSSVENTGISFFKNKIYHTLMNYACKFTYWIQKKPQKEFVVYRGKNLTTNSHTVESIRMYFKRKFSKEDTENATKIVLKYINTAAMYVKDFQKYLIQKVDELNTYWEVKPKHFSHYFEIGTTVTKGLISHPIMFYQHVNKNRTDYTKLYMNKKHDKIQVEYHKYFNILKLKSKDLFKAFGEHIQTRKNIHWDRVIEQNQNGQVEYQTFNGTCYPLMNGVTNGRPFIKIFDYLVLHKIFDLWNPWKSEYTPEIKGSDSVFRWWLPRDWVKFTINYVDRLRRSLYLNIQGLNILGPLGLEQDLENCKPGWPLYRDPAFNCSVTRFELVPFYYTEEEEQILMEGINTGICSEFSNPQKQIMAWIKYINAVISPFFSFPFIIPNWLICKNEFLSNQLSDFYILVDGKVKCYYESSDFPPFYEACLFIGSFIWFWILLAIYLIVIVILILSFVRCAFRYGRMISINNRLAVLEEKIFGSNRAFIRTEDE